MTENTPVLGAVPATSGDAAVPVPPLTRKQRVHALRGKYAFVPFSSDDHICQKEIEKQLEERAVPQ